MSILTNTETPKGLNSKAGAATAITIGARTLANWGATYDQGASVLRVSRNVYAKALNGRLNEIKADRDQILRASMIVDMHGAIRTVFSNPENVKGFMRMKNDNPFFDGRSPLDIIESGDFISLYETHRNLTTLRGAGW